MPSIGPVELIIVLVIALIILGPGRLPDVGSALGKSIREFRRAASDVQEAASLEPTPKPTSAAETPPAEAPVAAPAPVPAPTAGSASAESPDKQS